MSARILEDIKSMKGKGLSLVDIKRIFNHRDENLPAKSNLHNIDDLANQIAEIVKSAVCRILYGQTEDYGAKATNQERLK